jgi:DUF1009 family protein
MPPKLGIIAGGGELPLRLVEACRQTDRPFFVLALEGACTLEQPDATVRLGAVGEALRLLHGADVEQVVLAGSIKRPSMGALRPDAVGAKLIARLGMKLFGGDDALLSALIGFFEEEGFRVVGAEDVLAELVTGEGIFSAAAPDARACADIALGFTVAKALGALDVGQAVIVESGIVLGVEGAEGTDALIARCAELQKERRRAVLVKARKPQQEDRADLPTIGPETVRRLRVSGMLGVAVEAGASILLDPAECRRLADEYGLFVCALPAKG